MTVILAKRQPPLRSRRKRDLYRLLVARSDIHASHDACKLLLERVSELGDPLYVPLFSAIVVCYARPFTENDSFGVLPKKWGRFDERGLQDMHTSLIRARHELVAHSDINARRAYIVPPGVVTGTYEGRDIISKQIGVSVAFYFFTFEMIKAAQRLTRHLAERMATEIDDLVQELSAGLELPNARFPLRIDEGL